MHKLSDVFIKVIENSTDGVLVLNSEGRIIFINDKVTKLMERESTEILKGQDTLLSLFDFSGEEDCEYRIQLPLAGGGVRELQYSFSHVEADGRDICFVRLTKPQLSEVYPWDGDHQRHLYDNLPHPVVFTDRGGVIQGVNPRFRLLFGPEFSAEASLGDLYAEPAESLFLRRATAVELHPSRRMVALNGADGTVRSYLEHVWPHRCPEQERITGFTIMYEDISREEVLRAQLRITQTNYNRLFEYFASSIVIVDEMGTIVNMNNAAEQLYGYTRQELHGESYDRYFRIGGTRPTVETLIELTRRNDGKYIEMGVPRRGRDQRWLYTYVNYYVVEMGEENIFALFVVEKDLTARISLEKQLENSLVQIRETQAAAILGFARLTEYRDHCTGEHLDRIKLYTRVLAEALKERARYKDYITEDYIEDLALSSVLHDIGKIGIEDSILLKNGDFSRDEFETMKYHAELGGTALSSIDNSLGYQSFLSLGKEVAYYHHERWDGSGYPHGLEGDEIPLSARIVALADVYDAITSERPYKQAFPHDEAVKIILEEKGFHFDPEIVEAFIDCEELFKQIKKSE